MHTTFQAHSSTHSHLHHGSHHSAARVAKPLYIALDFDGVLHHMSAGPRRQDFDFLQESNAAYIQQVEKDLPLTLDKSSWMDGEGRLFDRLHQLEDLVTQLQTLRVFSDVRIVYATSWRAVVSVERLNTFLGPQLAPHVVGALDCGKAHLERDADGLRGLRMREWLESRGEADATWIALDDQWSHYAEHPAHHVQTHWRGLDAQAVDEALQRAQSLQAAQP